MAREAALYEIPKVLEKARVLDDSKLNEYNDSVKSAYNSDKAREVLSKFGAQNGELTNSNPFMLVALQNSGLLDGARIATRQDLETASRISPHIFSGNYIDFGLSLRTPRDSYRPNDLLAETLGKELKQRRIKLGNGKLIPISALRLRENSDSEYGLVFDLSEDAEGLENLFQFKWDYMREQGLAGAYLDWGGWGSDSGGLAGSGGDGRVVVVSDESAPSQRSDEQKEEEILRAAMGPRFNLSKCEWNSADKK